MTHFYNDLNYYNMRFNITLKRSSEFLCLMLSIESVVLDKGMCATYLSKVLCPLIPTMGDGISLPYAVYVVCSA